MAHLPSGNVGTQVVYPLDQKVAFPAFPAASGPPPPSPPLLFLSITVPSSGTSSMSTPPANIWSIIVLSTEIINLAFIAHSTTIFRPLGLQRASPTLPVLAALTVPPAAPQLHPQMHPSSSRVKQYFPAWRCQNQRIKYFRECSDNSTVVAIDNPQTEGKEMLLMCNDIVKTHSPRNNHDFSTFYALTARSKAIFIE